MIEKLKNIFLGKKISFEDDKIGALTTRVKNVNASKEYSWSGESLLPNQNRETTLILEGKVSGPYRTQLNSSYQIIDELELIKETIFDKFKLYNDDFIEIEDWKKKWYLDFLCPMDVMKNEFHLIFEPYDLKDVRVIHMTWINGEYTEFGGSINHP